ncbi:hypothetical protein ILUMI_22343 [Ignelater luminosus]|uniref:Uncharacterized protein n=1 Tax=Ignelater luminosus TaxID=2038154 RepID=A0A8K0CEP8_IGNLU|nr:hypothetical protein ILUMI_22343 [Ignelater luminosus]
MDSRELEIKKAEPEIQNEDIEERLLRPMGNGNQADTVAARKDKANNIAKQKGNQDRLDQHKWGSPIADVRGEYRTKWMATLDMIAINQRQVSPIVRGESRSYIDITYSTRKIARNISEWIVFEEETLTEHQFIEFRIRGEGKMQITEKKRPVIDWNVYKTILEVRSIGDKEPERTDVNQDEKQEIEAEYKKARKELKKSIHTFKKTHCKELGDTLENDISGNGYRIAAKKLRKVLVI